MNINITIPDTDADTVINNIGRATGFDPAKTTLTKKQWAAEQLAKQARAWNSQGAMLKARDGQTAVNTTITG